MNLTDRINNALTKLREIEECKGVTDGPWTFEAESGQMFLSDSNAQSIPGVEDCDIYDAHDEAEPNLHFIARSRTITPALAKALIVGIKALSAFGGSLTPKVERDYAMTELNSILEIVEAL